MTHDDLIQIAYDELVISQPNAWDTRAFEMFKVFAIKGGFDGDDKELKSAFEDAIAKLKENQPQLVSKYRKSKIKKGERDEVKWADIQCVGGVTNGDEITLTLQISGRLCQIDGTDQQWVDPAWVHRKLQIRTRQVIDFPWDKKDRDGWYADGLLPWLKSDGVQESDYKTNEDIIIETLRAYCLEPLNVQNDPNAWTATRAAIYEDGVYYILFSGFMDFVRRRTGTDHRRSLSNALTKISMDGGTFQKRIGVTRLRFYRVDKKTLYAEEPDISNAGVGQDDDAGQKSADTIGPVWDSVDDELRTEERREDEDGRGIPF